MAWKTVFKAEMNSPKATVADVSVRAPKVIVPKTPKVKVVAEPTRVKRKYTKRAKEEVLPRDLNAPKPKKVKPAVASEPVGAPKKRGRPSKEDIRLRELAAKETKLAADAAIKATVLATRAELQPVVEQPVAAPVAKRGRKPAAPVVVKPLMELDAETIDKAKTIAAEYDGPVFMVGDRVKEMSPGGEWLHGVVMIHDLRWPTAVYVRWDDKSQQYHSSTALKTSTKKPPRVTDQ